MRTRSPGPGLIPVLSLVAGGLAVALAAFWALQGESRSNRLQQKDLQTARAHSALGDAVGAARRSAESLVEKLDLAGRAGRLDENEIEFVAAGPIGLVVSTTRELRWPPSRPEVRLDTWLDRLPVSRREAVLTALGEAGRGVDRRGLGGPRAGEDSGLEAELERLRRLVLIGGLAATDPAGARALARAERLAGGFERLPSALGLEALRIEAEGGETGEAAARAWRRTVLALLHADPDGAIWLVDAPAAAPAGWVEEQRARARTRRDAAATAALEEGWSERGESFAGAAGPGLVSVALMPTPAPDPAQGRLLAPGEDAPGAFPLAAPFEDRRFLPADPPPAGPPWRSLLVGAALAMAFAGLGASVWWNLRLVARERSRVDARAEFLAAVSHQLKTPVANLRLFAETLRRGGVEEGADRDRMTAILESESIRLGDYLERILTLSRIEQTAFADGEARSLAVLPILDELARRFAPRAERQGVRIAVETLPESHALVRGEESDLLEALGNLVANALDHAPPRTTITLRAEAADDELRLLVRDEGPGIPPAERERVFERFFRGEGERKRRGEGTGLGLAIARDLVRGAGGKLAIEATGPEGTTMGVTLPRADGGKSA
ncbi:MAG: HAMP domain-containing sensor histidine kinase [Planctomycetota bacterium]